MLSKLLGALAVTTCLGIVWSRASQPDDPQSRYTIKVNVSEVVLNATVIDRKGKFVSGLSPDDFEVDENGVTQKIAHFSHEDVPVTVGLVIDNSGSMRTKRSEVLAGATALVRLSNSQDETFVVNFNESVSFGLPADAPFTDNLNQLDAELSRGGASGETALYDAVAEALVHLKRGTHDKKVLIVISDGGDNASKNNLPTIKALVAHAEATIYAIGVFDAQDTDRNPRALRELAKESGGEAFFPNDLKEIVPICQQIARDIRNQYTIAYIPATSNTDGEYRAVEVKANAKGRGRLTVRTRAGYFAHPPKSE